MIQPDRAIARAHLRLLVELHASIVTLLVGFVLTGHALVDDTRALTSVWPAVTRERLRRVVGLEIALFVSIPIIAIVANS